MKKSRKSSEFYIMLGVVLLAGLLGLSLLLFESGELTGRAVLTKGISSTKESAVSKTLPSFTKENSVSPPVQSLPQPAPPSREGRTNQCTQCGKQYEYRAMQGMCGGTVEEGYSSSDPGLSLSCSRTDGYNEYRYTDGVYSFDMKATARCQEPYTWIVAYGAECPGTSTLTKIGPTSGAMVLDANSWSSMPLVGEVEARCKRISALPSEVDDAEVRIYITCMREKR